MQTGRLTMREVVEIARQVAATLVHAHEAGVVHRDLKPDNIFLVRDGDGALRVKVLDFGVAKFMRDRLESTIQTTMGCIVGTPWYMAPEQCRASEQVDHRSDIYALGCVLYHLATGKLPFPGRLIDVLDAHLNKLPPTPRSINGAIPLALENLIMAMLAKRPEDRPGSMGQVARALGKLDFSTAQQAAVCPMPPASSPDVARARLRAPSVTELVRRPRAGWARSRWPGSRSP
jgi:serine/threonine protein kinase